MSGTKRVSITIASDILDDLDYLCNRLSVTRSSLISEALRPTVSDVRRIVDFALPPSGDSSSSVRARNPSELRAFLEGIVSKNLSDLGEQLGDISNDKH